MKDHRTKRDRRAMAASLWAILSDTKAGTRRYRRAFCWAVLANFRSGLAVVPTIGPNTA
jgi:hypothetical protein